MIQRTLNVVGAGVFGMTAALALQRRGWAVTVFDPGPIPHPRAASTDISKVIRMEYGPDTAYMELAERAREGWLRWNAMWRQGGHHALYHETGVLMVCRDTMGPGDFEWESYRRLLDRGHVPERMTRQSIKTLFPAWNADKYVDGFFHEKGGYAESGAVIRALVEWSRAAGVIIRAGVKVHRLLERGHVVIGLRDAAGHDHHADETLVAAGAWTGELVDLPRVCLQPTGHPVFHLAPRDPALFAAERFPTFTADISRTGYYGFPVHRQGVVKVANHGPGTKLDPDEPRAVTDAHERAMRAFLAATLPSLATDPITFTRLCVYTDTQDGDFWIARDPRRSGVTVASGGSGHGFKFAPVLGDIIADTVEAIPYPLASRFRWRPDVRLERGYEAARAHASDG